MSIINPLEDDAIEVLYSGRISDASLRGRKISDLTHFLLTEIAMFSCAFMGLGVIFFQVEGVGGRKIPGA